MELQRPIQQTLDTPSALAQVRALAEREDVVHRTALADAVCARFGFVDARGRPRRGGCLKALREFERRGVLTLPAPRTCPGRERCPRTLEAPVPAPVAVPARVEALEGLRLVRVDTPELQRVWSTLLSAEHPRGAGPLVGCQLRYLVGSAHGWLGALGFASAACTLAERDRWIGWDAAQRRAHRARVVGLARFLIRPSVRCHNLASQVLGAALRALPEDFAARFGYRPWLVESFVERPAHTGASYRAANWQWVGQTRGRGRGDRARAQAQTVKDIYVYVLEPTFRARMGVDTESRGRGPLAVHAGLDGTHWAEHEFGGAPLGDKRLSQRLVDSAARQAEDPMRSFASVAKSEWAAVKGYYRLIDQPEDSAVTPANMLAPHRERTLRRMQAQRTVLCIQDGTDLNFTTHPECSGLGVIGTNQTGAKARGLHLHSTFAVTPDGLPLGVLEAQFDAPQPKGAASAAARAKKSQRWLAGLRTCVALREQLPTTRLVSVCDREADFFELFDTQRHAPHVELLIRAKSDRRIRARLEHPSLPDAGATDAPSTGDDDAYAKLFERLRAEPEQKRLHIAVGRQSARPKASKQKLKAKRAERIAEVALHYAPITLAPTDNEQASQPPVGLWVVHVREEHPPENTKPLEWFLLTTVPVESTDTAEQMLTWYALRWRIEDFHRVLKSGCRVERLAHDTAERLARAIAMRLVIAWRIMLMTLLSREVPALPPELMFSDIELKVLGAFAKTRRVAPPTTLGEAVRILARLGGYLARNNDGPPGHQVMWHGYADLHRMCVGFLLREQLE